MLNNVRNYFRRPVQLMILVACLTAFFIFFTMFDAWYVNQYLNNTLDPSDFGADRCNWKLGDPVLLNLKTKLGVNYEGSHWFHMAENLMVMYLIFALFLILSCNVHTCCYDLCADATFYLKE